MSQFQEFKDAVDLYSECFFFDFPAQHAKVQKIGLSKWLNLQDVQIEKTEVQKHTIRQAGKVIRIFQPTTPPDRDVQGVPIVACKLEKCCRKN